MAPVEISEYTDYDAFEGSLPSIFVIKYWVVLALLTAFEEQYVTIYPP